jgi:hypothetical protein
MKCDSNPQDPWRKYRPYSHFLISKASIPRLLIQVNSTETECCPEEEVRMLLQGAAVVRFANTFLEDYNQHQTFVLVAIYLKTDGTASHYTLFEPERSKSAPKLKCYPVCCALNMPARMLSRLRFRSTRGTSTSTKGMAAST